MGVFQPRRRPSANRANSTPSAAQATTSNTASGNTTTPSASTRAHLLSREVDAVPLVWVPPGSASTPEAPTARITNAASTTNTPPTTQITAFQTGSSNFLTKNLSPLQSFQFQPQPNLGRAENPKLPSTPQIEHQQDYSGYPLDFLDSLHRLASDQRVAPRNPPIRLMQLLEFLMRNRVPDSISFSADCMKLYNEMYSRKMKILNANRQKNQETCDANLERTPSARTPQPSESNVCERVTQKGSLSETRCGESQDVREADVIQHVPAVEIQQEVSRSLKRAVPTVTSPMFSGRESLSDAIQSRWQRFIDGSNDAVLQKRDNCEFYTIWAGREETVRLPLDYCRPLKMLQDKNGELCEIHLTALRYLWHYIIAEPCAGAVFNPSIGYPTAHVVLTFYYLVSANSLHKHKRMVIFCPPCKVKSWETAAVSCRGISMLVLQSGSWEQGARQWQERGGLLLCPFNVYHDILYAPSSLTEQRAATIRLLCRPGPSIAIVDEATRLVKLQPALRRSLNRIKTKSRLALTNMPRASNMVPFWSIIDWAVPEYLGSLEEYLQVFLGNIVRHNLNGGFSVNKPELCSIEKGLEIMFQAVVHDAEGESRENTLQSRGFMLRETTIFLKLSPMHRKIYDDISNFVLNARNMKHLSNFVAMHILLLASTSILALLQLLRTELQDKEAHDDIARRTPQIRAVFEELLKMIQRNIQSPTAYAKLQVVTKMCDITARSQDKLVIFCAMPEVQKEVIAAIRADCAECEVLECDISMDYEKRNVQIRKFNSCKVGAVLLIPLGFTVDFCEEGGWEAIHSSHVLVLEHTWNETAVCQGINRVYNFATTSDVHAYFLSAADTIDDKLHIRTAHNRPSSLLLPYVADTLFKPSVSVDMRVPKELLIDDYVRAVSSLPDFLFAKQTQDRCIIGQVIRGNSTEDDKYRAALHVASERMEYFRSLPRAIDAVQELSYRANLHEALHRTRVYRAYRFLSARNCGESGSFLSLWKEHFYLYEQNHSRGPASAAQVQARASQGLVDQRSDGPQSVLPQTAYADEEVRSEKRVRPIGASPEQALSRPRKRRPIVS